MNDKTLGIIREFLTAIGAALIAYGHGTASLWETAAGGILAGVMLIWGVVHNEGMESWFTLARKILSAVGGVLTLTGVLAPDKAEVIIGVVASMLSMLWSAAGKEVPNEQDPPSIPPAVPLLALLAAASFLLPSCAEMPLTGTITLQDPTTGAKGGLTYSPGKAVSASIKAPITDASGKTIGYVDLKSSK